MTIWKDGGQLGQLREIANEDRHTVCLVLVQRAIDGGEARPWPEGKANFALILQAPRMLEALEAIQEKAEHMMHITTHTLDWTIWDATREIACAAIAAVKGEDNEAG